MFCWREPSFGCHCTHKYSGFVKGKCGLQNSTSFGLSIFCSFSSNFLWRMHTMHLVCISLCCWILLGLFPWDIIPSTLATFRRAIQYFLVLLNKIQIQMVYVTSVLSFCRGEKAFCSAECRCKQISSDELKEKRGSGAKKPLDYSVSPCSSPMQFFAGVAAA